METNCLSDRSRPEPWNKGKLIGQKPPLKAREVWAIRVHLRLADRKRDLALFNLAIDIKLRSCDLVRLRVNDLWIGEDFRHRAKLVQSKTGEPVQFEVTSLRASSVHHDVKREPSIFCKWQMRSPARIFIASIRIRRTAIGLIQI